MLWFAFKFVSLTYQIHCISAIFIPIRCCDLLLNLYLWHIKYTRRNNCVAIKWLWFAFKFVSLTYQIHWYRVSDRILSGCDLLLNLYLWHIKYTLKEKLSLDEQLWFAFKFVSLTYQIHCGWCIHNCRWCCDLLLNLYLWHIKYTPAPAPACSPAVVICF